jgi:hypothetical protein
MKKSVIFMFLFFVGTFFVLNLTTVNAASMFSLLDVASECTEVIDAEVYEFLQQIFDVIKYAGPLLCLVFSVIDFVKAAASQDKDALTKAGKTTGKRVVYALILFFIPTLIDFLFPLLGWVGTCGIG